MKTYKGEEEIDQLPEKDFEDLAYSLVLMAGRSTVLKPECTFAARGVCLHKDDWVFIDGTISTDDKEGAFVTITEVVYFDNQEQADNKKLELVEYSKGRKDSILYNGDIT